MNSLPPSPLRMRTSRVRVRAVAAAVMAVATAMVGLGACGDPAPAPSPSRPEGTPTPSMAATPTLLLLVGTPGEMHFALASAASTVTVPATLDLPRDDLRWASGHASIGYVVGAGPHGQIFTTETGTSHLWREVVPKTAPADLHGPPSFPVLSPDGRWIAALTGDPASGAPDARLLIVDRGSGATRAVPLRGIVDGRPPSWIGDGRVAIPLRDQSDRHVLSIVDPATGAALRKPIDAGCVAASADGSTVVTAGTGILGTIATGSAAAFLSGTSLEAVPVDGGAHRPVGQMLLDRAGSTLAVAWLDEAGDITEVDVYGWTDTGWTRRWPVPLPADITRVVLVAFSP